MKPSPPTCPNLDPMGKSMCGSKGPLWARAGEPRQPAKGESEPTTQRLRGQKKKKKRSGHCFQGDFHSSHLIRPRHAVPNFLSPLILLGLPTCSPRDREGVQAEALGSSRDTYPPGLFYINTKPSVLYLQRCLTPASAGGLGLLLCRQVDPPTYERGTQAWRHMQRPLPGYLPIAGSTASGVSPLPAADRRPPTSLTCQA